MTSRGPRPHPLVPAAALVVAGLCLVPVVALIVEAIRGGGGALDSLLRPSLPGLVLRSVALAVGTGVLAAAVGTAGAWLTTRSDLPGRRLFAVLFVAPIALPSYVAAYLWIGAVGSGGLLRPALQSLGLDHPGLVEGFVPALLVMSVISSPYAFLTVRAALLRTSPDLEDAARTLGRGPVATFREVVFPQIRPAVWAGGLLAGVYALSDFGAVSLLRCDTFTATIYNLSETVARPGAVAMHALVLVVVCVILVLCELRLRPKKGGATAAVRRSSAAVPLGRGRPLAVVFASGFAVLGVVVPLAVLAAWGVREGDPAVRPPDLFALGGATVRISLSAALATTLAALPVALFTALRRGRAGPGRLGPLVEAAAYVGYVLPGIVLALALVDVAAPQRWLYQTPGLLVFAYAVRFLPQASGSARAALEQADPVLEEAARTLGRTRWGAFVAVTVPRIAPGVLAGCALVFLTTMKELPATLILSPPGFNTLATGVWSLTEEGQFAIAAGPAAVLVVLTGIPSLLMLLTAGRGTRRTRRSAA